MKRLHYSLIALFGMAFLWLSSLAFVGPTDLFLSPDETAIYQSATTFAQTGTMRLTDVRMNHFPWLHARSFVTVGDAAVPVGFIGMPLIVGVFVLVGMPWFAHLMTPLLVLIVGMLIWRVTKSVDMWIRLLSVLTWFALPNVVLYSNRGLFPNLVVICLTAIAGFLMWEKRTNSRSMISGITFALALAVRPIDIFWMLPWMGCAWFFRQEKKSHQENRFIYLWLIACSVILLVMATIQYQTYGSFFTIGYFLRDPVIQLTDTVTPTINVIPTLQVKNWFPFGFHPMHVWFNVREYVFGMLWPWLGILLATTVFQWKKIKASPWTYVFLWTASTTILVYGQGVYQDHVGLNVVSIGNSFLRYLLPCSLFVPFAVVLLLKKIQEQRIPLLIFISGGYVVTLAVLGLLMAYQWGAESVQNSAATLRGYASIRDIIKNQTTSSTVIFSERSDKIFFTPQTKPVSPVPPISEIARFKKEFPDTTILYFGRKLDEYDVIDWVVEGIMPKADFVAGNEVMYTIDAIDSRFDPGSIFSQDE
ncbi:hypothetical protein IT408_02020 [Candidatus Uhrbacteria bacterium]|nr:hypothetical protein [Candidatus Uhrbacteria bacterium]